MKQENERKGGGKLSRSETVTVRLDPKRRYLGELAARKQRRTLSSFIEWAIEQSLEEVSIQDGKKNERSNLSLMSNSLWDVDLAQRFLKLAVRCPELLNYKEQRIWKLIDEWGALWDLDVTERRYFRIDLLSSLWHEFEKYGSEDLAEDDLVTKVVAYLQKSGRPLNTAVVRPQPQYINPGY